MSYAWGMAGPQSYLRLIYAQIIRANYSLCSANVFQVNCVWSGKGGVEAFAQRFIFHSNIYGD